MRSRIQFFFWLLMSVFTIPSFVAGVRALGGDGPGGTGGGEDIITGNPQVILQGEMGPYAEAIQWYA